MLPGFLALMVGGGAPSAVSISIRQSKAAGFPDAPNVITLDSAPLSGNILVLFIVGDSTVNDASLVADNWVQRSIAVDFTGSYIYSKVSAGTETSTTVNYNLDRTNCLAMVELSNATAFDKQASATGQGDTTISTGTTAATTTAVELAFTLAGLSNGGSTPPLVSSWDNGFVTLVSTTATGTGSDLGLDVAYKLLSATGAQTSTATLDSSGSNNNSGLIATFK